MQASLPPEILNHIVDHLHDDTITLQASCLVSKLWVPRIRRHLFASVEFHSESDRLVDLWMGLFPDPQDSPTQHTRILVIDGLPALVAATTFALPWIHRFGHLVELRVSTLGWIDNTMASLVQLHGLSPTLKSLSLSCMFLSFSEVFGLICSFPLLEDLKLAYDGLGSGTDEPALPATSPKLTGSFNLRGRNPSIIRQLLHLPNGLHFSKIKVLCLVDNAELTMELVLRCSDTLESLYIWYYFPGCVPPSTPPLFSLSKYSKLKVVKFRLEYRSIKWVIMTLQATRPKSLQQIEVHLEDLPLNPFGEMARDLEDLDRLLVRLWTSHSILPKIKSPYHHHVLAYFPEFRRMREMGLV